MKLRTAVSDKGIRHAGRTGFIAKAALVCGIAASGCTFESQGLPALDAAQKDARQDAVLSERIADSSGCDNRIADASKADVKKHDVLPPDIKVYDTVKPCDAPGWDALKPDSAKPDAKQSCPLSSTGFFSGTIFLGTPQSVGGYLFDFKGIAGLDAIFDISCGGSIVKSAQKCPAGKYTVITVPADSKKITIKPFTAGASGSSVSIAVEAP